ncbi:hypothetical protein [Lactiplantibacillus xiangfangensis]
MTNRYDTSSLHRTEPVGCGVGYSQSAGFRLACKPQRTSLSSRPAL